MDLVQIRHFLTLAQCLNFTRAAEACNVTQPAITKSIQRLENELGRHILPALRQTFEAAETAHRLAAELRSPGTASLRVGPGPDVESFLLQPLIAELGSRLPGFRVTLREGTAREVNDWLLAIGYTRINRSSACAAGSPSTAACRADLFLKLAQARDWTIQAAAR